MLHVLRRFKKSVFGLIIVAFVGMLMSGFGMDFYANQQTGGGNIAIEVGDKEITALNFYRQYQNVNAAYRERLGENYAQFSQFLNLKQQTTDAMINDSLMENFLTDAGFTASKKMIKEDIAKHPFFAQGFNQAAYNNFLAQTGLRAQALETMTEQKLAREQLEQLFKHVSTPTDSELRKTYAYDSSKFVFRYLKFDPQSYKEKAQEVSNQEIEKFFAEKKETYKKPKSVKYAFVAFTPTEVAQTISVSEEDINTSYEERASEFALPEEYKVRKIVFNKPKGQASSNPLEKLVTGENAEVKPSEAQVKAVRALAEAAFVRIQNGEEFSNVASEVSQDVETKEKGGDLGWNISKNLQPEIKQAVRELDRGEVSEIIETDSQFLIVSLDDFKESSTKPLAQVKEQIVKDIQAADAPTYAFAKAEEFYEALRKAKSPLAEFAQTQSKTSTVSPGLVSVEEGTFENELTEKVISFPANTQDIIEIGDTTYVVEVLETKEAYIPELSEVQDKVKADFIEIRSQEIAKEEATKALEKKGDSGQAATLEVLARETNSALTTTEPLTRTSAGQDVLANQAAKNKAFNLLTPNQRVNEVLEANGTFYILELVSITPPDFSDFEKTRKDMITKEVDASKNRILQGLLTALRANTEIKIHSEVIDRVS